MWLVCRGRKDEKGSFSRGPRTVVGEGGTRRGGSFKGVRVAGEACWLYCPPPTPAQTRHPVPPPQAQGHGIIPTKIVGAPSWNARPSVARDRPSQKQRRVPPRGKQGVYTAHRTKETKHTSTTKHTQASLQTACRCSLEGRHAKFQSEQQGPGAAPALT